MKKQKGITLIALIITIIVMLILVGVSVSVALNTGLFKTAQGAAKNTQLYADKENLLSTGWITVINATTGNLDQVHISSFGQTTEEPVDDAISVSPNPTYILEVFGKKYKIDQTTTIGDFVESAGDNWSFTGFLIYESYYAYYPDQTSNPPPSDLDENMTMLELDGYRFSDNIETSEVVSTIEITELEKTPIEIENAEYTLKLTLNSEEFEYPIAADTTFAELIAAYPDDFSFDDYTGSGVPIYFKWKENWVVNEVAGDHYGDGSTTYVYRAVNNEVNKVVDLSSLTVSLMSSRNYIDYVPGEKLATISGFSWVIE